MKSTFTTAFILAVTFLAIRAQAQNTFPSTGRVGIYTTSPATSLQVKGGARFGTLSNYVNIDSATGNLSFVGTSGYLVDGNKYAFQYSGNPNYGLYFNSSLVQYEFRNGSAVPVFSVNANSGNSVINGTLKVGAYTLPATDGTSGQTLTTNGAGTVNWSTLSSGGGAYTAGTGIGISGNTITNTAPDKTVSLTGSGATTVSGTYPNFTVSSTDNNTTYTAGTGISISGTTISSTAAASQWTTSGTNIYNSNAGNVGIGTSTPGTALTIQIPASIGGYGIESTNGTISIKSFLNSTIGQIGTYSNHPFQLMANNGINQFVLLPNGNVGIGNGTPSLGGLVVDTKAGAVNAIFGSNTTGVAIESNYPGIGFNTYYNSGRKFIAAGYGGLIGLDPTSGLMSFYNSATSGTAGAAATIPANMVISSAGNVGIGNTNPQAPLSFANSIGNKIDLFYSSANNRYGIGIASGTMQFYTGALGNSFQFGYGSSTSFKNSVTIGTDGLMQLTGVNAGYIFSDRTSTNYSGFNWYATGGKAFLYRYNQGGNLLAIDSLGQMGLGTATPAYKLDVCGTIRAKEVLVQTGWCDYVFADDYKLRSVSEVESYININKHLPDVPSATEVEEKGVQVAQMDSILIKKVEELTLYMIDQNKQIQQLQQKIIQLESKDADKKNR